MTTAERAAVVGLIDQIDHLSGRVVYPDGFLASVERVRRLLVGRPDHTRPFLGWLHARGGAFHFERPAALDDEQAAECRRKLLRDGLVAYDEHARLLPTRAGAAVLGVEVASK